MADNPETSEGTTTEVQQDESLESASQAILDIDKKEEEGNETERTQDSEEQEVEEESSKRVVKKKRIIKSPIQEMMTVECPQCSSQIEITKVSGSQPIQCPDCGLEGEIEV